MTAIVPYSDSNRQPSIFNFNGNNVRVFIINGEEWWVASDVCDPLEIGNVSQAVSRLDDDEKTTITLNDSGRPVKVLLVNEPGLYSLIGSSRKPVAKTFRRWVNHEVLPTIRKTGSYSVAPKSLAEQSLLQAQALVDHENRLQAIEARLNAADEWTKHYTIIGYCNLMKLPAPTHNESIGLGHRASKLSRDKGYKMGKTNDPRFGEVNTYHVDILKQVFGK